MTVNSNTARADIFKEFLKVIKDNLTTTGVKITNAFVDDVAEFPQIVINPPIMARERHSFGTSTYKRDGEIDIEIYASTTKAVVELYDDVENTIFSNLNLLSTQNIQTGDSSIVNIDVGGKTIKGLVIPLSYMFRR